MGKRVLVWDLDVNASASRTFGRIESLEGSVGAALLAHKPLGSVIQPTEVGGIWLAPASAELHAIDHRPDILDPERVDKDGTLFDIARALEFFHMEKVFDYVLVDCPGGHNLMHRLALLACDEVIIPTGLSVYDLQATAPSLQMVGMARQIRSDNPPRLLGFLPNGAGRRGVPAPMQEAHDEHKLPCFSPVRHSALLKTMAGKRGAAAADGVGATRASGRAALSRDCSGDRHGDRSCPQAGG